MGKKRAFRRGNRNEKIKKFNEKDNGLMRFGWGWNLGLDWDWAWAWAWALAGVIWIPPLFLNYGSGPPFIIILRFGFKFFFLQMLAGLLLCVEWLGTEPDPPSLLLDPTSTPQAPHPRPLNYLFSQSLLSRMIENKVQVLSSPPLTKTDKIHK